MNHGLLKFGARTKLLVGALALATAGLSHASATTLVGGGATLPAIGYTGTGAETNTQVFPAGTGSLFAVYTAQRGAGNPTVSYCQTGSGSGKNILAGVANNNVQTACPLDSTGTMHGFGANAAGVGRSDLTQPSFAGADSPLAASDVSNYTANHSGNFPVQFPAVAGAITIAMNMATANGVALNTSNTNFSDAQICSIFSGAVTNWADPSLASAFTLQSGDSIPSTPINVVYRSDGSGTSFSFSNHLTAVCSGTASQHFLANQTFTTAVSEFLPTIPSNWLGESGNPAVTHTIALTAGSLGYAEMANSLAAGIPFAKVDSVDPATFGSSKFQLTSTSLLFNEAIGTTNDPTTGAPTTVAISGAPSNQCIVLVDPASYANPHAANSSAYPIVAVSYLMGNSAGDPVGDVPAIQRLLGAPYNAAITGSASLTQFGAGKGLALLDTSLTGIPSTTLVSSCVN